jgi:hypothetical protein
MDTKELFDKISKEIHSDTSPVGIDAKKTHIMILLKLEQIMDELKKQSKRIDALAK